MSYCHAIGSYAIILRYASPVIEKAKRTLLDEWVWLLKGFA